MKYFIEDGNLYALKVKEDEWADSPREFFDVFTKMCLWKSGYSLGDYDEVKGYDTPYDYIADLLRSKVNLKQIVNYIRQGETRLRLSYNRHERNWFLYELHEEDNSILAYDHYVYDLEDYIIENLTVKECFDILEKYADIIHLPLYIYEHSMISIRTGSFGDRWDSGFYGFIWTDKELVNSAYGDVKDWKRYGYNLMESDVKLYDMYLQGSVYIIKISPYDPEKQDFDFFHSECVGGFYSDAYGDDLYDEIAEDFTHEPVYDLKTISPMLCDLWLSNEKNMFSEVEANLAKIGHDDLYRTCDNCPAMGSCYKGHEGWIDMIDCA